MDWKRFMLEDKKQENTRQEMEDMKKLKEKLDYGIRLNKVDMAYLIYLTRKYKTENRRRK